MGAVLTLFRLRRTVHPQAEDGSDLLRGLPSSLINLNGTRQGGARKGRKGRQPGQIAAPGCQLRGC
jgi:hypothetical protein